MSRISLVAVAAGLLLANASPLLLAVDDAFAREVAALPAAQQVQRVVAKLKQLNPGFDGNAKHKIENNQVVELSFSSAEVKDISPVAALKGLRKLSCAGTRDKATLKDISPLRGMPLTELNLQDTGVTDLSPLAECPLTFLDIRGTPAMDFSPLANLRLKELRCDTAAAANKRAAQILMQMDSLESLNGKLAVDFLREISATLSVARPSTAPASAASTPAATTPASTPPAAATLPIQQPRPAAAAGVAVSPSAPQFSPVQLMEVKPTTKKKDLSSGYGNVASYQQSRALAITICNGTQQPVSGVIVRWGVVKADLAAAQTAAYGEEQTLDLRPMETRTIETASVTAVGKRWNYRATEGEKIMGHGVQVLFGGKVVVEEFSPPSVKLTFEKLKPIEDTGAAAGIAATSATTTPRQATGPATTIPTPPTAKLLQGRGAEAVAILSSGSEKTMTTSTGMELVWIPPGEFMMGSTDKEREWATGPEGHFPGTATYETGEPKRTKIKSGFWIGRTKVTMGQWKKFVDATGYVTEAEKRGSVTAPDPQTGKWGRVEGASWRNPNFGFALKDNHPVCCITWKDAVAFCEWLTETEKKADRLSAGMTCRLPTEAEWEYACHGSKETMFWWGNTLAGGKGRANVRGNVWDQYDYASPVDVFGARGRNGFGLADMLGNLFEWCLDGFDPTQAHDEPYQEEKNIRVLRGGCFNEHAGFARCAARYRKAARDAFPFIGFRVCCGVPR